MTDVLCEIQNEVQIITLNRTEKHNAFDDVLIKTIQSFLEEGIANPLVKVIMLHANGNVFSAGADLDMMQRMVGFSEDENIQDAMLLAKMMYTLYHCPKPTLAVVPGAAFGGGVGLVAACDIAIAATHATFCFSEVRLGLIPAIISPYVIKAVGERNTNWLFMSAEVLTAQDALRLGLIHFCQEKEALFSFAFNYASKLASLPPMAVRDCKSLVRDIANKPISKEMMQKTATLIAKKRVSAEAQVGLKAFLAKRKTHV